MNQSPSALAEDGGLRPGFRQHIETIKNGIATPFERNDPRTRTFGGCIYRPDGSKVSYSERFSGPGILFSPDNPEHLTTEARKTARQLPGRTLYLGHYAAHFGHFLIETLSTFWALQKLDVSDFDHIAFHPLAFGKSLPFFARYCFEAFGINPDQLVFLDDGPVHFDEVVVPDRLFRPWNDADPALNPVYTHIRNRALQSHGLGASRKIYLSRRRSVTSRSGRIVANEIRIEEMFARQGFQIVYPETLSFPDQLALYGGTRIMAGMAGSALHNGLFMPRGGQVIELQYPGFADSRFAVTNQDLCDRISGVTSHRVAFSGHSLWKNATCFHDMKQLERSLADVLPDWIPDSAPYRIGTLRTLPGIIRLGLLPAVRVLRARIPGCLVSALRKGAGKKSAHPALHIPAIAGAGQQG
jgi:hypothetical protein